MKKLSLIFIFVVVAVGGCSGSSDVTQPDTVAGQDTQNNQDNGSSDNPAVYAGSAAHGDLVVFSVFHEAGICEVVNETTGQDSVVNYTVMDGDLAGVMKIVTNDDTFFAVELTDKLIAASFDTGNPNNTISFGVDNGTDNIANQANIPGDYVYIAISNQPVNGSTDIREWGVMSVIDDGTFRVKYYATDAGDMEMTPMAPEDWSGQFPIEDYDITGTWSVDQSDTARLVVNIDDVTGTLTGFAYAPDPNGIFVLDMGEGNGFILAMKILPTLTLANLQGEYKFINVWNDNAGQGRSAGKAVINSDGTGSFGAEDTEGGYSAGVFDYIAACPLLPNMFHATSTESDGEYTVTLKHYFVLLPYAYMGFNFRTDDGFKFVGYSVGARLDQ